MIALKNHFRKLFLQNLAQALLLTYSLHVSFTRFIIYSLSLPFVPLTCRALPQSKAGPPASGVFKEWVPLG